MATDTTAAEAVILGALLSPGAHAYDYARQLSAENFTRHDFSEIAGATLELIGEGAGHDGIATSERLRDKGQLDACGGMPSVMGLAADCPAPSQSQWAVDRIVQASRRRKIEDTARRLLNAPQEATADDMASDLLKGIEDAAGDDGRIRTIADVFPDVEQQMRDAAERWKSGRIGIPTGLPAIDKRTSITGPRLIFVAARPGMGKTAFLNQIAISATSAGCPGLICSLEMSAEELTMRAMASMTGADFGGLMRGIEEHVSEGLRAPLGDLPLYIDDSSYHIDALTAQIAGAKAKHGIQWAAVDYIGLVETGKYNSRSEQINAVARNLKKVAKRLGIPVLVLSQLTRSSEKEGRWPELHDLRDAGEQDADAAIFLHTPPDNRGDENRLMRIGILKNRTGQPGWLGQHFHFNGRTQQFREVDERYSGA